MPLRKRKPTSAGRRFQTVSDFSDVTTDTPEKSLLAPLPKSGGRNSYGRKTARHRGGGHKRQYRILDFKRDKDGVPAKVATIEHDPNRNARIALLHYLDGEKRYILAPAKVRVGDLLESGQKADIRPGNALALRYIPVGTTVHNVEMKPGAGGKMGRGAGASIQLVAKEGDFATLRLPSTEMRRVPIECRATIGEVGNSEAELISIGKAGRNRWKGVRPQSRGVAMNPVDHPHGGGEGKTSGGRHPVSPWGQPEGRTRNTNKPSQKLIIRRRRTMSLVDSLFWSRVRPSGLPQGDTGCRPPEDLPSPPPRGWSTGFMATPRVWGRTPFQRLRPAFPIDTSSASALPTSPMVARQSIDTRRISVLGRRKVAKSPSLATSWTLAPAPRPSLAPAPAFSSTLCTVVPTGT